VSIVITSPPPKNPERLWTLNFVLLWQGQLVSILGDVVYSVALGFWILAVTGSTALMGGLLAASTLPRVLAAPIAGVVVDRGDRRMLMVWMDVVRGAAVVTVGITALAGFLQVWMVFAAGVILGLCGAFFTPAVSTWQGAFFSRPLARHSCSSSTACPTCSQQGTSLLPVFPWSIMPRKKPIS